MMYAQLSFPKGKQLNLHSSNEFMYDETGIFFHTGKNKITDYNWNKLLLDSLDPRWDFQACMNGDCKIGLPQNGPFIPDFGLNDTTGFIKMHVYTAGKDGASYIQYKVSHKTDTADYAILKHYIFYKNTTAVKENSFDISFSIYPNPASNMLFINNTKGLTGLVKLMGIDGKLLQQLPLSGASLQSMNISGLQKGMYFLTIQSGEQFTNKMIQIEN